MRLLLTLALTLFLTTGCNLVYKQNIQQGNAIEQEDLDKLRIGMTRNQVAFLLGTPAIRDPFHRDRWDFVSTFSRRGEDAVMRKVTLYFEDGLLSEMVGVEGDEFIYEEDEPAETGAEETQSEAVEEASSDSAAEVTPLAAPVVEQEPFDESALAEPAPPAATMDAQSTEPVAEFDEVIATTSRDNGAWVIQLGAFDSNENARGVVERLEAAGVQAEITEQSSAASDVRYVVRKTGIESRAEAERLLEEIADGLGINGFLVPPGS